MTIIAYRDGILAADSGEFDEYVCVGSVCKIISSPDGAYGAASGSSATVHRFHEWMMSSRLSPLSLNGERGSFSALIVMPDMSVWRMSYDGYIFPGGVQPFYAEGCARDIAIGAMAFGATALEAAKIAVSLVPYCRAPLMTMAPGQTVPDWHV